MLATTAKGRLSDALRRMTMKRATVTSCEAVSESFRLITIEGPSLRDVGWIPGQKVQIAMAAPFVTRTYTPIEWDAVAGRSRLLGYRHGDGPGNAWVQAVEPGAECDIFGPRSSIDAARLAGLLAVFGDETSIGLAYALSAQAPTRVVSSYFEVGDIEDSQVVTTRLGLSEARLWRRTKDDTHLDDMEAMLPLLVDAGAIFVLTGRAAAIQRLVRSLKNQAVPAARIITKAYWSQGKTGLD